ncbi:MAG: hypothetical protein ACREF4_15670 [Gammaproteobacteria bacterium]
MERRDSGLFVAHGLNFLRYRATKRTVTLPSGERALVTVDDSGTVTQVEHGDQLDAIVRPKTVRIQLRKAGT